MIDSLMWLAILPSAALIFQVLKSDRVESEPIRLLARVFVLGAVGCLPAAILESIGEGLIMRIVQSEFTYAVLMFLIVVPCSEELVKYVAMNSVRKNPAFNFTFDGIVYGVMASLGFATLENLFYVLGIGDLTTAIVRGLISVPLHCACGVFMGYYFGLAQWYRSHEQAEQARFNTVLSYVVPVIIHGLYDFSLSVDSALIFFSGLALSIVVLILAVKRVRASSTQDTPFGGIPIHQVAQAPAEQAPVPPMTGDSRSYAVVDERQNKDYRDMPAQQKGYGED